MTLFRLITVLACFWAPTTWGQTDDNVRRLISLVDYIGGDYAEAVRNGEIVNENEFLEMQNFADSALTELEKLQSILPPSEKANIRSDLDVLKFNIQQKVDVLEIRALTNAIKDRVIDSLAFETSPKHRPSLESAQVNYDQSCSSCHGPQGEGDGPASTGMEPPPRNFHDEEVMAVSSPFKFYNTLVLGVEGTSMISYRHTLSDSELWSLAFYVTGLQYGDDSSPLTRWENLPAATRSAIRESGVNLAMLARLSNRDLQDWLANKSDLGSSDIPGALEALRAAAPYLENLQKETGFNKINSFSSGTEKASDLQLVRSKIAAAKAYFEAGNLVGAEEALLDAYLQGYEKVEARLGAQNPALVSRAEQVFIAARRSAASGDKDAFGLHLEELLQVMDASREALQEQSSLTTTGEFLASLVIILREGFEAFLIIGTLLALLSKTGATHLRRWVHIGWTVAIAAGIASYFLFTHVFALSGASRETIEAIATAGAAGVLFYVSFWLLHRMERSRWERYINDSVKAATGSNGKILTLFFLSFIAVYREAAETVLFYQALVSSSTSTSAIFSGLVVGSSILLVICTAMVRYGNTLPLRQFFLVTSSVMILIAIVLSGKAVNELIEAGYLSPTSIPQVPTVSILGIYPHWESLGVQFFAIALATFLAWKSISTKNVRG